MNAILFLAFVAGQVDAPLVCPTPNIDAGTLRGGPAFSRTFRLENRSKSEVTLLGARSSCGCVVAVLPGEPLAPGAACQLPVDVRTISQPEGTNAWFIPLRYRVAGEAADREIMLRMQATLHREVAVTPAAITLIGGANSALKHELVIIDRRPTPLPIRTVHASSDKIRAAVVRAWSQSEQGWTCTIRVGATTESAAGKHDEFITIYADDPDYQAITIPVTVMKRSAQRVTAMPDQVHLQAATGAPASVLLLVRDRDGQPVEIESATSDDPALALRWAEGSHRAATLRVSVTPGKSPLPTSAISIKVKAPEAGVVRVPVQFSQSR